MAEWHRHSCLCSYDRISMLAGWPRPDHTRIRALGFGVFILRESRDGIGADRSGGWKCLLEEEAPTRPRGINNQSQNPHVHPPAREIPNFVLTVNFWATRLGFSGIGGASSPDQLGGDGADSKPAPFEKQNPKGCATQIRAGALRLRHPPGGCFVRRTPVSNAV
jgi:hypothetical protein